MNLHEKERLHYLPMQYQLLREIVSVHTAPPAVYYPYLDDLYIDLTANIIEVLNDLAEHHLFELTPELPTTLKSGEDWIQLSEELTDFYSLVVRAERKYVTSDDTFEMNGMSRPSIIDRAKDIIQLVINQKKVRREQDDNDEPVKSIKLEPRSYDQASAVLLFAGQQVLISRQKNKIGKQGESHEAYLMRRLFLDVNRMRNGITYRQATTVVATKFSTKNVKQVRNYIAAINKKVEQSTGVNKDRPLIIYNQKVLMINSIYLLN